MLYHLLIVNLGIFILDNVFSLLLPDFHYSFTGESRSFVIYSIFTAELFLFSNLCECLLSCSLFPWIPEFLILDLRAHLEIWHFFSVLLNCIPREGNGQVLIAFMKSLLVVEFVTALYPTRRAALFTAYECILLPYPYSF